jgi:hypothetical protein
VSRGEYFNPKPTQNTEQKPMAKKAAKKKPAKKTAAKKKK